MFDLAATQARTLLSSQLLAELMIWKKGCKAENKQWSIRKSQSINNSWCMDRGRPFLVLPGDLCQGLLLTTNFHKVKVWRCENWRLDRCICPLYMRPNRILLSVLPRKNNEGKIRSKIWRSWAYVWLGRASVSIIFYLLNINKITLS